MIIKILEAILIKTGFPRFRQLRRVKISIERWMNGMCMSAVATKNLIWQLVGFPVQSAEETNNVVEKIIEYETASYLLSNSDVPLDEWRNIVTMVGDDENRGRK